MRQQNADRVYDHVNVFCHVILLNSHSQTKGQFPSRREHKPDAHKHRKDRPTLRIRTSDGMQIALVGRLNPKCKLAPPNPMQRKPKTTSGVKIYDNWSRR